jgi:hypothetical protein
LLIFYSFQTDETECSQQRNYFRKMWKPDHGHYKPKHVVLFIRI